MTTANFNSRTYSREHKGFQVDVKKIQRNTAQGKVCELFCVTLGKLEYTSGGALTHTEAAKDAVDFWLKKGDITRKTA